jgi:hypothetical protein
MREELLGCLEDHASLHATEGQFAVAARLAASAAAMRDRLALVRSPRTQARWEAGLAVLREALKGAAFDELWNEGQRWESGEAVHAALAPAAATN